MLFRIVLVILFIIALPFQAFAKNIEDYSNNFKIEIPDQYLIPPKKPEKPFLFIGIDSGVKGKESVVFISTGEILESCSPEDTLNIFNSEELNGLVNSRIKKLKNSNMIINTVTTSKINNRMYILSTYKNEKGSAFCLDADLLLNKRLYTISFITSDEETYNIKAPEYIKMLKSFDALY